MNKELKEKILKYGALAGAATTVGVAEAQVQYTDIPDTTISGNGAFYDLDLNQDTIPDFRITHFQDTGVAGNVNAVLVTPFDTDWNLAAGEAQNGFNYPFNLTPGTVLDENRSLDGIGGTYNTGYMAFEVDGIAYPNSNWVGPVMNGFLGMRFRVDEQLHFGWARIDVSDSSASFTVKDFAYEQTPDSAIVVGAELLNIAERIAENTKVYTRAQTLVVELKENIGEVDVRILDLQGRTLSHENIQETTEFSTDNYPSGLYLVQLRVQGVLKTEKIVF